MEEYIEKKNGCRGKAKKSSCGRKRARAKKIGVSNSSPWSSYAGILEV